MVNTIWKENFLIMCSKLCLNARDSGHFAQLLLICRNYSLQTLCGAPHNVCDDEGKLKHKPLNRPLEDYDVLSGDFFVCGLGEDDFTSLTDEQLKRYEQLYHDPVVFVPSRMGIIPMKATPEQYARVMKDTEMRKNASKERRSHNER